MRVFLVGASGAIGRRLVPQLIERGHKVIGSARSPDKAEWLRGLGAESVVLDALDARDHSLEGASRRRGRDRALENGAHQAGQRRAGRRGASHRARCAQRQRRRLRTAIRFGLPGCSNVDPSDGRVPRRSPSAWQGA